MPSSFIWIKSLGLLGEKLCRRWPLLPVFLTAVLVVLAVDKEGVYWVLPLLFLPILVYVAPRISCIAILSAGMIAGMHWSRLQKQAEVNATIGKESQCQLLVVDTLRGGRCIAMVERSRVLPIGSEIMLDSLSQYTLGDVVIVEGWGRPAEQARNPGAFNEQDWLWRKGVAGVMIGDSRLVAKDPVYASLASFTKVRDWVKERLASGIEEPEQVKVIHSMFLGERYGRGDPLTEDFRLSGAMHVFAVSGLHVMLAGMGVLLLLRALRLPIWVYIPLTIVMMVFYTGITGWGTPAVRACVMATIFLSGYLVYRKPKVLNSMAASGVVLLAMDSHQLFNPGFQLSFGVLIAIVMMSTFWHARFAWIEWMEPFLPRSLYSKWQERWWKARQWLTSGLAVTFSAWMGSAPLIALYFKMVSPIGLIIGVPVVLSLTLVMWLSMISLSVGVVSDSLSNGVNQLNGAVAASSRWLVGEAASSAYGHYKFEQDTGESVEVFDVKSGGAVYLNFGGGTLIDTGGIHTARDVEKALAHFKRGVDSVMLSHADVNHSGGLASVIEHHDVQQILAPTLRFGNSSQQAYLQQLQGSGVSILTAKLGELYSISEKVQIEVLYNGAEMGVRSSDDSGLVLMLHWDGSKILFINDGGFVVERALLQGGADLKADVLVLGKHADGGSTQIDFINAVAPKVIIATGFPRRWSEQRDYGWKKEIQQGGYQLYLQSETGAVSIEKDSGGKLHCVPYIKERKGSL